MLDLNRVQRIINRPHIVDLRDGGFTLMHPPACHPRLFDCDFNLATRNNLDDPGLRGQYECFLYDDEGVITFTIGDPTSDIEGVDWNTLVAELRAAREELRLARTAKRQIETVYESFAASDPVISALTPILLGWDNGVTELEEAPDA